MCRCGDVAHKHSMKASLGSEQNHIFQLSRREESRCYVILIKCRRVKQTFHQLSLMKFTKLPEWMCERTSSKANQPPNNRGNNVVEHVAMERWCWVILATEKLSFHQKFKIFSYCYKHELSKLFLIKINKVELEDNEEDKLMFSIMFTQVKYNKNHIFYFLYIRQMSSVSWYCINFLNQCTAIQYSQRVGFSTMSAMVSIHIYIAIFVCIREWITCLILCWLLRPFTSSCHRFQFPFSLPLSWLSLLNVMERKHLELF